MHNPQQGWRMGMIDACMHACIKGNECVSRELNERRKKSRSLSHVRRSHDHGCDVEPRTPKSVTHPPFEYRFIVAFIVTVTRLKLCHPFFLLTSPLFISPPHICIFFHHNINSTQRDWGALLSF